MSDFYDKWLNYWNEEEEERVKARKFIHEEELEWVRTKQDYRAAPLCTRENGFITAGAMMLGEIPKGWNTGKHSHGEEAMFIIDGEGFSVVDDKRYDWDTGSCLFMPYGSIHQHFNSGDRGVRYLSAMGLALERFAGLAKVMQYEQARETPMKALGFEKAESDIHPEYGRIVLRLKDAVVLVAEDHGKRSTDTRILGHGGGPPGSPAPHARVIMLMGTESGFKAKEALIMVIACDAPEKYSLKHGIMEGVHYCLQGEGYTVVDGEKVTWKKGTLLQIQGPQTVHQEFNTGEVESQLLQVGYGLKHEYFKTIASRVFPRVYCGHSSYA